MKELAKNRSIKSYLPELGGEFSFLEKLRMNGTGSAKCILVENLEMLENDFNEGIQPKNLSFELFPKGLVVRINQHNSIKTLLIHRDEIESISFLSRKIRVYNRTFLGFKKTINHDAGISLNLKNERVLRVYVPQAYYKSMKHFFQKGWLKQTFVFKDKPGEPLDDIATMLLGWF